MARLHTKPHPPQKGDKTSGRTMGHLMQKMNNRSQSSSESRPLRVKNQPQPRGKNRFPNGKYTLSDPTGTKSWEDLDREWEEKRKR